SACILYVGFPSLSKYSPSADFTAVGSPDPSARAGMPAITDSPRAITKTMLFTSVSLAAFAASPILPSVGATLMVARLPADGVRSRGDHKGRPYGVGWAAANRRVPSGKRVGRRRRCCRFGSVRQREHRELATERGVVAQP